MCARGKTFACRVYRQRARKREKMRTRSRQTCKFSLPSMHLQSKHPFRGIKISCQRVCQAEWEWNWKSYSGLSVGWRNKRRHLRRLNVVRVGWIYVKICFCQAPLDQTLSSPVANDFLEMEKASVGFIEAIWSGCLLWKPWSHGE